MPSTGLLSDDGRFLPTGALIDRIGDVDGVYCGSGVTASVVLAALAAEGVDCGAVSGLVVRMVFGRNASRGARLTVEFVACVLALFPRLTDRELLDLAGPGERVAVHGVPHRWRLLR